LGRIETLNPEVHLHSTLKFISDLAKDTPRVPLRHKVKPLLVFSDITVVYFENKYSVVAKCCDFNAKLVVESS